MNANYHDNRPFRTLYRWKNRHIRHTFIAYQNNRVNQDSAYDLLARHEK